MVKIAIKVEICLKTIFSRGGGHVVVAQSESAILENSGSCLVGGEAKECFVLLFSHIDGILFFGSKYKTFIFF